MRLGREEIGELANFCARRFPGPDQRAGIAARAGLDAPVAGTPAGDWTALITDAQARRRLPALARALAAADPDDTNLQAACRELGASARSPRTPLLVAGAVVLLATGWWLLPREGAAPAAVEGVTTGEAPEPPPAPVSRPADPVGEPAAPEVAVAPVAAPLVAEPPLRATHPCDRLGDGVVGWWYAGTTSPGAAGETIVMERDARVRAEYPSAANGHDARTRERCVLGRGTRVRLSQPPVDASNSHWWVPYSAGDALG